MRPPTKGHRRGTRTTSPEIRSCLPLGQGLTQHVHAHELDYAVALRRHRVISGAPIPGARVGGAREGWRVTDLVRRDPRTGVCSAAAAGSNDATEKRTCTSARGCWLRAPHGATDGCIGGPFPYVPDPGTPYRRSAFLLTSLSAMSPTNPAARKASNCSDSSPAEARHAS